MATGYTRWGCLRAPQGEDLERQTCFQMVTPYARDLASWRTPSTMMTWVKPGTVECVGLLIVKDSNTQCDTEVNIPNGTKKRM